LKEAGGAIARVLSKETGLWIRSTLWSPSDAQRRPTGVIWASIGFLVAQGLVCNTVAYCSWLSPFFNLKFAQRQFQAQSDGFI